MVVATWPPVGADLAPLAHRTVHISDRRPPPPPVRLGRTRPCRPTISARSVGVPLYEGCLPVVKALCFHPSSVIFHDFVGHLLLRFATWIPIHVTFLAMWHLAAGMVDKSLHNLDFRPIRVSLGAGVAERTGINPQAGQGGTIGEPMSPDGRSSETRMEESSRSLANSGSDSSEESGRLISLYGYGLLDTEAEDTFDEVVALAAKVCDAPMALVSLVDADRQWFKARFGIDITETPRSVSFLSTCHRRPRRTHGGTRRPP